MKRLLSSYGIIALLATVVPSILVYSGTIELETHKTIMVAGMILWFVTAPFFMKRKNSA
jgi:predicted exporter